MKRAIALAGLLMAGCPPTTSCVARGTRVLTPDGWRPIEDLVIGDSIYAIHEEDGVRVDTRVVAIRSAMREVGFVAVGDVKLRMTSDHPVYCPVERDYFPAGDWFLGKRDRLALWLDEELQTHRVTAASTYVAIDEVFDITVDHECHNFVAEGVLVHNKSPLTECEYQCGNSEDPCECYGPDAGITDIGSTDGSVTNNNEGELDAGTDAGSDATNGVDMSTGFRERGTCSESNPCSQPD